MTGARKIRGTTDKLTDPQIVARVKEHFLIDR